MAQILVLDDNPDIVSLVNMTLQQQGHAVIAGRHGQEGIELLEHSETLPDLILSNYYMPQMNGIAFLEWLRAHSDYDAIPFIMVSAAPGVEWQQQAAEMGAAAFITKPFKLDHLVKTVNRAIHPN